MQTHALAVSHTLEQVIYTAHISPAYPIPTPGTFKVNRNDGTAACALGDSPAYLALRCSHDGVRSGRWPKEWIRGEKQLLQIAQSMPPLLHAPYSDEAPVPGSARTSEFTLGSRYMLWGKIGCGADPFLILQESIASSETWAPGLQSTRARRAV